VYFCALYSILAGASWCRGEIEREMSAGFLISHSRHTDPTQKGQQPHKKRPVTRAARHLGAEAAIFLFVPAVKLNVIGQDIRQRREICYIATVIIRESETSKWQRGSFIGNNNL